ncbi:MAG: hypothetical protein KKB59_19945 [Spirochaetes bacterium]|nr:hypothetical protein [Spirochaetota bacterium]
MKTFKFEIVQQPEYSAGILGFNETVTIQVESGDLGDKLSEDGFVLMMKQTLSEYYDTPHVKVVNEKIRPKWGIDLQLDMLSSENSKLKDTLNRIREAYKLHAPLMAILQEELKD